MLIPVSPTAPRNSLCGTRGEGTLEGEFFSQILTAKVDGQYSLE